MQTRADPTSATGILLMPCRHRASLEYVWKGKTDWLTHEGAGLAHPLFPMCNQPAKAGYTGKMKQQSSQEPTHLTCHEIAVSPVMT